MARFEFSHHLTFNFYHFDQPLPSWHPIYNEDEEKDDEMEMVWFQSSLEAPEWAKDPRNGLISIGGKLAGPFGVHFRDP